MTVTISIQSNISFLISSGSISFFELASYFQYFDFLIEGFFVNVIARMMISRMGGSSL